VLSRVLAKLVWLRLFLSTAVAKCTGKLFLLVVPVHNASKVPRFVGKSKIYVTYW